VKELGLIFMTKKVHTVIIDGVIYSISSGQPIGRIIDSQDSNSDEATKKPRLNIDTLSAKRIPQKVKPATRISKPQKTYHVDEISTKTVSANSKVPKTNLARTKKLPITSSAKRQKTRQTSSISSFRQIVVEPLPQIKNPFIFRLSAVKTLFSLRLFLAVVLPIAVIYLSKLSNYSVKSLAHSLSNLLLQLNLNMVALAIGLFLVYLFVGMIAKNIITQIGFSSQIKRLDNRKVNAHMLLKHSKDFLFKPWANSILNLFWASLICSVGLGAFLLVKNSTNTFIVAFQSSILNILIIAGFSLVLLIIFAGILQKVILSVTDHKLFWSQLKGYGLTLRNFLKLLASGVFWLFLSLIAVSLIIAICITQINYSISHSHLATLLVVTCLQVISVTLIFSLHTSWSMTFWSNVYYDLVNKTRASKLSDYLSYQRRPKGSNARLIIFSIFSLVILSSFILLFSYKKPMIKKQIEKASRQIDITNFDHLIPRIK
jgi:hypothetical protein